MPQPKHAPHVLILVAILGFLIGTFVSKTFSPLVDFMSTRYHLVALGSLGSPKLSEVQEMVVLFIFDLTLMLSILLCAIAIQKKTKWQLTG